MTKFTYGVYLGLFVGLFSSIVVYYFLPDLFPIYPNILSTFGSIIFRVDGIFPPTLF